MENAMENDKIYRILDLYERLNKGEFIDKKKHAALCNVNEKSIQRDISDLNKYFSLSSGDTNTPKIVFDRKKGYLLSNRSNIHLTDCDIFALTKILFESRAFSKKEMDRIINSLLCQCDDKSTVKEIIQNENFYYTPPKHDKDIVDFIWEIILSIRQCKYVQVSYERQDGQIKERKLKPLGLVFNEYYFYLIAQICGLDKNHPAVFRVDRFSSYQTIEEKFSVPYKNRFEEGQYRKRIHFMYQGDLINIQFKFWGDSLDAVLDRIPTARVMRYDGEKAILEAEVYDKGIIMWLLSQKEYLELTKPQSLRKEIKETIARMLKNYSE
jgi:predicted DNA-binding transcriptional regulator YafY